MLVLPSLLRSRENAISASYIEEVRIIKEAFMVYHIDNGKYPADTTPSVMPSGMSEYLKGVNWAGETVLGGKWDWDRNVFGVAAGVSVYQYKIPTAHLQKIDKQIDDNNVSTGNYRTRSSGYIAIIE